MRLSRRGILLAGASAWLLPAPARAADSDAATLSALIAREEAAALAYRSVEALGLPFALLADHEAGHAVALRTELAALGLKAPPAPRDAARLEGEAARLARAGRGAAAFAAARTLEAGLVDAYAGAVRVLVEPDILRTVATVMASHGQHLAVLQRTAG